MMIRYLLALTFFFLYAGDELGLSYAFGAGLSSKNMLLYLIITGIAIDAAVARNRVIEIGSVLLPYSLLILYAAITWLVVAFILSYPEYSARESFIRLKSSLVDQFLMFLIFFYGVMHTKDAFWLLRAMIWIAIAGNVVTLIDAFNIPNLGIVASMPMDGRFEGFIGQANEYGMFLVLLWPISLALYMTESGKVRVLAAIGMLSTAFALILTVSRGAYAGALAGPIIAVFYLRKHISTQAVVRTSFGVVCAFAVLVLFAILVGYSEIFQDRLSLLGGDAHLATSGRSTIWTNAVKAMFNNPLTFLTGYGFNAYESSRDFYAATHNTYLNYLFNLGAIGLFLFLMIFARVLGTVRSVLVNASATIRPFLFAVIFGLFSLLVSLFFGEYHHGFAFLLWGFLGVTMRLAVQSAKEDSTKVQGGPGAGLVLPAQIES